MKKKLFFGLVGTLAIALAAVITTTSLSDNSSALTDLQKQNIKALAGIFPDDDQLNYLPDNGEEGGGGAITKKTCYYGHTYSPRSSDITYECRSDGGCIKFSNAQPAGARKSTCKSPN